MNKTFETLIEKLEKEHSLTCDEYAFLIENRTEESQAFLSKKACDIRKKIYGTSIYIRALIEISSYCKNNCFYCGLRFGNAKCERYRLTEEEILSCAEDAYSLGFRTFVLQGGEDTFFSDDVLCPLITKLKKSHPDCAITLSLGERSKESYRLLFNAGSDRYLLRHETADKDHYEKLHPSTMSFENRIQCLKDLKEIGFQTGSGFMVASPFQTPQTLSKDLKLIEKMKPDMCGIGPFIPNKDTPFAHEKAGGVDLTCYLISIIRLMIPTCLIPATTALASVCENGREKGLSSGANVIMPNVSPMNVRKKYRLYDGKAFEGTESAQAIEDIKKQVKKLDLKVEITRGDNPSFISGLNK